MVLEYTLVTRMQYNLPDEVNWAKEGEIKRVLIRGNSTGKALERGEHMAHWRNPKFNTFRVRVGERT